MKFSFQQANRSLRFYKGSLAVLNQIKESEFILVPQSEKDVPVEIGMETALEDAKETKSKSISFNDFCNFRLFI